MRDILLGTLSIVTAASIFSALTIPAQASGTCVCVAGEIIDGRIVCEQWSPANCNSGVEARDNKTEFPGRQHDNKTTGVT